MAMATLTSKFPQALFVVQEGPELSGKSSAVARLAQVVERALPILSQELQTPVHVRRLREPGGSPKGDRGRTFVMNILALQEMAQTQLRDSTKAEIFTWARWGLYDDIVPEITNSDGFHILLGDRSYLSMMALQGQSTERANGVSLTELEESATWATKGLLPDTVLLRKFPVAGFAESVSLRQLMILLTGREVMPQDLTHYTEFASVQRVFDELSVRYQDQADFHDIDAAENPIISTRKELEIVSDSLARKFPLTSREAILSILLKSFDVITQEGRFTDLELMVEGQQRVKNSLAKCGTTAEQVMDRYRVGDETLLQALKQTQAENLEGHLPKQARK